MQTFRLGTFAYCSNLSTFLRPVILIGETGLGASFDEQRVALCAMSGGDLKHPSTSKYSASRGSSIRVASRDAIIAARRGNLTITGNQ